MCAVAGDGDPRQPFINPGLCTEYAVPYLRVAASESAPGSTVTYGAWLRRPVHSGW